MSLDAGRFLCEYILFTSLWEYHEHLKDQGAPVTFFHVPTENEAKDIEKGKEVAMALIQALAQNLPR
jgi:pyrrolidone-carboxylate peptidase